MRFVVGDRKEKADRKEARKAKRNAGSAAAQDGPVHVPTAEELEAVNARPKTTQRTWVRLPGNHLHPEMYSSASYLPAMTETQFKYLVATLKGRFLVQYRSLQ